MRILLTNHSFSPESGGPARSVSGLANALARLGHEVSVWAPDASLTSNPFIDSTRVDCMECGLPTLLRSVKRFHLVHDNGIWRRQNRLLSRAARRDAVPRIVSPRGMLEPWALRHKRFKKHLAWWLYQRSHLIGACAVHATSSKESLSLGELGLDRVFQVPNGIDTQSYRLAGTRLNRTAIYVGRLCVVKGLSMLLEAWSQMPRNDWKLRLAGPDEDGYRNVLSSQIERLGLHASVSIEPPVDEESKRRMLTEGSLFICPSYTENFGLAIAEAIAAGLPVITTTGTPWRALRDQKLGWWVEPNTDELKKAIGEAMAQSPAQLLAMGERAQQELAPQFDWGNVASEMVAAYERVLQGASTQPPTTATS